MSSSPAGEIPRQGACNRRIMRTQDERTSVPQLQLTIDIGERNPEPFEDALFALGALSVTLEDAADDPVLEPAPGATPLWPTVVVKAVFDARADADVIAVALMQTLPGAPSPRFEILPDKAWEREWLKDFRPMRFGRRLWVCPGGLPADDPDAIRIELDPGLAFGTGTHPTTALCLGWLDGQDVAGRDVVDYGCGSGILAIAAARLGAATVRAIDIDPQALIATHENAERNGVGARLVVTDDPLLDDGSADLLLANILAGPLVELAPRFARAVRPEGLLALSGLLVDQAGTVTAAYQPWFDIGIAATRDGWALLAGRRRADGPEQSGADVLPVS
jgi:ribosomal protein L11 methyltransferase